jgi:hypothetical protein
MDPSCIWAKPQLTDNTSKIAAIDRSMPANAGFPLRVVQTIFIRSTVLPSPDMILAALRMAHGGGRHLS